MSSLTRSYISPGSMARRFGPKTPRAFSLPELLVVIGIITLLGSFAVPAFQSIGRARGVGSASEEILIAIERARLEAVSRNSYTWLVFQDTTVGGTRALRLGTFSAVDGTTNMDPTNLVPIGRYQLIESVGLGDAPIPGATQLFTVSSVFKLSIGDLKFENQPTLIFTPSGEVSTNAALKPDDGFSSVIAFSIRQARGSVLSPDDSLCVVIDGSTATAILKRLEP